MIKIRLTILLATFLFWLILNWAFNLEIAVVGVLLGGVVSFLIGNLFNKDAVILKNPLRYLWFLYYIPLFAWESFKANLDGAYRVIHPGLPMNPGIVRVKTVLRSDTALTILANTLTLKPGTMTVDIDKEAGLLYVHWIDVKSQDLESATKLIVRRFEKILVRIFE